MIVKPTTVVRKPVEVVNDFPIVSAKEKGTLIINSALEEQINIFHSFAGGTEWSGILLYKVIEGDILKPEKLVIETQGMFPMDIGTPGYTEYDYDERTLDMYDLYPEALPEEWRLGHIHTHHNMKAFFSGTDLQELKDNTINHAYYLSLIVNFKKEYCAKICIMGEHEVKENSILRYSGLFSEKNVNTKYSSTRKEKIVYVVDLNIQKPDKAELDAIEKKPSFVKEILALKAENAKTALAARKSYAPYGGSLATGATAWGGSWSGPLGSSYKGSDYDADKSAVDHQMSLWDSHDNANTPRSLSTIPKPKGYEDKLIALFLKKLFEIDANTILEGSDFDISGHSDIHYLDDLLMVYQQKFERMTEADQELYFDYIIENIEPTAEAALEFFDSRLKTKAISPHLTNGLVQDTAVILEEIEEVAAIYDKSDFLGGIINSLNEFIEANGFDSDDYLI